MNGWLVAARVTLLGFRRDPALLAAVLLLLASLGFGALLGSASVGGGARLTADIGVAAAGGLGGALALLFGSGAADRRGVLGELALARPVAGGALVAGRFAGLAAGLGLFVGFAAATGLLFAAATGAEAPSPVAAGMFLLWLRLVVVLSVATLFAAFARPAAALVGAAAVCLAGWFSGLVAGSPGAVERAARLLLPDLRAVALPAGGSSLSTLLAPAAHAALYVGAMLAAALVLSMFRLRKGR